MAVPGGGLGTSAAVVGIGTCCAGAPATRARLATAAGRITLSWLRGAFDFMTGLVGFVRSARGFEMRGLPAAVERGLQGTIEAQEHEVVLAGNGARPIA